MGEEGVGLKLSLGRAAAVLISASFHPRAGERYEFHACQRDAKPWRSAFRGYAEAERPGRVEIPGLPPGNYRLAICSAEGRGERAARRLLGEERLQLSAGERREIALDLDGLETRFGSISGKVVGPTGSGNALVNLVSEADPEELYAFGPTPVGPDGAFRFAGLPAGRYLIQATRPGGPPASVARLPVQVGEREERDVELKVE